MLPVVLPAGLLVQPGGVLPFDPLAREYTDLISHLTPAREDGATVYPISIEYDPHTWQRLICASDGSTAAVLPPPRGFDPTWYARALLDGEADNRGSGVQLNYLIELFDPSRIIFTYRLLPTTEAAAYAVNRAVATALIEASLDSGGGGMAMMMMQASYTNLQFVGVEPTSTNPPSVLLTIGYPDSMATSVIDVVTTTNLLAYDWSLHGSTNATTATNVVTYPITNWSTLCFAGCYPHGWDSDGDGVSDGDEHYLAANQTDLDDPNDPPNIKGSIDYVTYSGGQTGPIHVVAVTASSGWSTTYSDTLSATGAYHVINVPTNSYWIKAFRDSNGSGTPPGTYEATGIYSTVSMSVTGQHSAINVTLTDPDTDSDGMGDWWELSYFTDLDSSDTDDNDIDKLSNLMEYRTGNDPTNGPSDADGDEMSDDWEDAYALNSDDSSDANEDPDGDGFTNLEEYINNGGALGTDPTDPNSHPTGAYYVDVENGDDTNSGSYASPFASISTGIVNVATGGRVVVQPGTYTGAANKIRIRPDSKSRD